MHFCLWLNISVGKGRKLVIPKECLLYWAFIQTNDVRITFFFFFGGVGAVSWRTVRLVGCEDKRSAQAGVHYVVLNFVVHAI